MANDDAVKFCKNLRASTTKRRMPDDTYAFLLAEASRFHLTPEQWARALSNIIAENTEGNIISPSQLKNHLHLVQSKSAGLGWLNFELDGRSYSVRIKRENGKWLYAPMICHDERGNEIILQENVGFPACVPDGAINISFVPDEPTKTERCGREEAQAAFLKGWISSGADPAKCPSIEKVIRGEFL